jgi:hypothetical protein
VRIELVFRTEDGDRFELRDSSSDFEGHAHGVKLEDGAVFAYMGVGSSSAVTPASRAGSSARRSSRTASAPRAA